MMLDFGMLHPRSRLRSRKATRQARSRGQEFALRGQRAARDIKYSDWAQGLLQDSCGSHGVPDVDQWYFRDGPVGGPHRSDRARRRQGCPGKSFQSTSLCRPGITIDQGSAYRFPYVWCLTNTCIAADLADPKLIKEMEAGHKLQLEVVDSSVLSATTALPVNQLAVVRQGTPTQTFEQNIDE